MFMPFLPTIDPRNAAELAAMHLQLQALGPVLLKGLDHRQKPRYSTKVPGWG
jgi:hypothetical protein